MGTRRIKKDQHKPRMHGIKQCRLAEANQKRNTQLMLREQVRRRLAIRRDSSGEEYTLACLALRRKADGERYTEGMTKALLGLSPEDTEHIVAIQSYLQKCVDEMLLVPIPCQFGGKPTCRIYSGENKRIIVLRIDDPEANERV